MQNYKNPLRVTEIEMEFKQVKSILLIILTIAVFNVFISSVNIGGDSRKDVILDTTLF